MYFVASSGGHPVAATSTDDGVTWSALHDVGSAYSIRNTEFPMVVAGDPGRAAFAFYGTPRAGDDQSASFSGVWHLYVSYTYDGGDTWQTVDATPNDPVQRGCIWLAGGSNPCRNLLDFQDMTVDGHGRVVIGYADGCVTAFCVGSGGTPAQSHDSYGVIARQVSGKRLFAAYDP
ncbi:MAG: glycoside hydrolase, partial [Actinobacteria bacterium]|nr:glycoside hydrolase [Actinomycetota bacterium]